MNTADSLRYIRYELRLNQSQLASVLNVTRSSISCYESGRRHPSYATVLKILNLVKKHNLKVSLDDIKPE
jgi:transcriptional regulator with XRE-family HTH domain